ncbi:BTAD domain-containing putative transcriptional regulator [Actinopolymorpha sp. B11F2]|uniref:AfsR/SARP family transcriptional regulator n=1 Tax=Actinopolymorpha sp. B11F2 TaxID=3160862 RepID=UPI0032E3E9CD
MRIRVLGPLEVGTGEGWRSVTAAKWRSLLARLVVADGQVVPVDQLAEELWPQDQPRGAVNQIHGYVMRLRRALGDGDATVLRTKAPGYELRLPHEDIDAGRFDRLDAEGRAALRDGDADTARRLLAEALELWRGPAFADVPSTPIIRTAADRLDQRRTSAVETRIDADLLLGNHADLVEELEALTEADPFRERVWSQLMLALYRCGRQADALVAYQRLCRLLRDELGVEPSRPARKLHEQIQRADPDLELPPHRSPGGSRAPAAVATPQEPVPRQLPTGLTDFTGRDAQLGQLDDLLGDRRPPSHAVVITAIAGMGGIGKTSLAVHWAHRVAGEFPDGQLFADLRGYAQSPPREPGEVLAGFLRAMGMPPDQVPLDIDEAAALYRSLLADKRMLVVLDNAKSAEQVRPLLPGSASCLLLVTSRDQLSGLTAHHGAGRLDLDRLDVAECLALLTRILGERRVAGERAAAVDLIDLCAQLPLALRLAAADLAAEPHRPIAAVVAELSHGDRLARIGIEGGQDSSLRAAFDLSYERLGTPERRAFRLASLAPGPDFSAAAVAALAAVPVREARRLLGRLVAGHLLEVRPPGRYAFHDLLRLYAAQLLGPDERVAATTRLFSWYLHTAAAAVAAAFPHVVRLPATVSPPPPELPDVPAAEFDDRDAAAGWLEAERVCLAAVVQAAAEPGVVDRVPSWLLVDVLRSFYFFRRHPGDWITAGQLALAAATRDGSRGGEAASELSLAQAYRCVSDYAAARAHGTRAAALCHEVEWPEGEAVAYNELAVVEFEQGRYRAGAELQERAVVIDRLVGNREYEARHQLNIGSARLYLGQLALAADRFERTVELASETESPQLHSAALSNLAEVYRWQGRLDKARHCLDRALRIQRAARYDSALLVTTANLANLHGDLADLRGDPAHGQVAERHADTVSRLAERMQSGRVDGCALVLQADAALRREDHAGAVAYAQKAGHLFTEGGNRLELIDAHLALGHAYLRLGNHDEALTAARAAVDTAREIDARGYEGKALTLLARVQLAGGGDVECVAATARQALAIHQETGHRPGESQTRALLETLTES